MADSTKTDLKQATAWRRTAIDPALSDDLMERVLTPENLRRAWHQVKTNHGAPGVDGMTIEDFPAFAREHWPRIRQALREGTYQPAPVRRTDLSVEYLAPIFRDKDHMILAFPSGVRQALPRCLCHTILLWVGPANHLGRTVLRQRSKLFKSH
jgi:hypothetical protein